MKNLVSATTLAEILGVSRQTLSKKVKDGLLTPAEYDGRGRPLFHVKSAKKESADWIERSKRISRHRPEKSRGGRPKLEPDVTPCESVAAVEVDASQIAGVNFDNGFDFNSLLGDLSKLSEEEKVSRAEFVKKLFDAMQSALRAKEKEGSLIAKSEATKQGARLGAVVIGALNAMPDRLSQRFAVMDDPWDIRDEMVKEINLLITNIRKFCGAVDDDDLAPAAIPFTEGADDVDGS